MQLRGNCLCRGTLDSVPSPTYTSTPLGLQGCLGGRVWAELGTGRACLGARVVTARTAATQSASWGCACVQWASDGHEWRPAELCACSCRVVPCITPASMGENEDQWVGKYPADHNRKEYREPSKIQLQANATFVWWCQSLIAIKVQRLKPLCF